MTKIILINGKKRAGKDFFGNLLKEELISRNKTVEIMSLAEPMKQIISTTFGITTEQLEDYKNNPAETSITINSTSTLSGVGSITNFRKILQRFGTEGMKPHFGDAVWAELLLARAKCAYVDYVIVPDFRFLCEAIGDITIKIVNTSNPDSDTHVSENELNDFQFMYTVDNTGYRDLTNEVKLIVDELL